MTFLKKILLVDYEARANALVRTALEETGKYLVKEERDSRNAVNAARWFQPDLVLFDMSLTKRQAQAAARELQEDPAFHQTPVVFLSVNTSADGGVASGGILSGYSFMANPVRTEELVRYVADLIGMRSDLADAVRQIPTK